jgi:glycosyltransferase involved in cell wall biosynthesis
MHSTSRAAAVIAALNEATTIAGVVRAAAASPLVDEVLVVDGHSADRTEEAAAAAGARVLTQDGDKGEAMAAGVEATTADVVVFLDADLVGLRTHHVDRLVRTVTAGGAVMACGLFDRGRLLNLVFLHLLPILTGERALRRELFESLAPEEVAGYQVEAALNARAAELHLPVAAFVCRGMWHRTKEEKFATPFAGWRAKIEMLLTAMGSYAAYWWRHRRVKEMLRRRAAWWTNPRKGRVRTTSRPRASVPSGSSDSRPPM